MIKLREYSLLDIFFFARYFARFRTCAVMNSREGFRCKKELQIYNYGKKSFWKTKLHYLLGQTHSEATIFFFYTPHAC